MNVIFIILVLESHGKMTSNIGTTTYASPEQLSSDTLQYSTKSDIFSLGVIFFELFFPFATGMERYEVIKNLRKGSLPDHFVRRWPKEVWF